MRDVLLLAVVAAAFACGWFLMKKLDRFLEEIRHAQELRLSSGGNTLRLGFCNPMVTDSMADVLEQYSRLCPDISVRIFCGSEKELLKGLSSDRFDVIFLPENAEISAYIQYNFREISLNYTPVMMNCDGLSIEPVTKEHTRQNALWTDKNTSAFAGCFLKCLEGKFTTI